MLIPPRSASSTLKRLNRRLIHRVSRIIRPVSTSTVIAAAGMFAGWFQARPRMPLTTLPNAPKVAIASSTPAALPVRAIRPICIVIAPRSSRTVYPPASSTPVSFMLRRMKLRMLKEIMITEITTMITANSSTIPQTSIGRKLDPPRMFSQLTAI